MTLLLLTDQERDKFVAYCWQEVRTANEMAKQMEKSGMPLGLRDAMVKKFHTEVAGYMIVIDRLAGGEKMEIRG